LVVGTESHTQHVACRTPRSFLAAQLMDLLAPGNIPHSNGTVTEANGRSLAPIGRKADTEDGLVMAFKPMELASCFHLPETDRLVLAAREGVQAVGRKRYAADSQGMPLQR